MLKDVLLSDATDVTLDSWDWHENTLICNLSCTYTTANCQHCGTPSARVHSRYVRKPMDLPCSGYCVRLRLTVRRFFCDEDGCEAKTFVEQIPALLGRYERRTHRLVASQRAIAFTLGGEAGARLATILGMPVSADTLLRIMRKTPTINHETPRVLGVDDWARRKGQIYGTILVDLEQRKPIDLLPDRSAKTFAAWLLAHPGVEVISRDRGNEYRMGATMGAPEATQVADRWHLLKNLRQALERFLERQGKHLRMSVNMSDKATVTNHVERPTTKTEQYNQARKLKRQKRFETVKALHEQGLSNRAIAREMRMGPRTVAKYLAVNTCPMYPEGRIGPSKLDPYQPYLNERWQEGCHNASQLYREIRQQGYDGSRGLVARWAVPLRHQKRNRNDVRMRSHHATRSLSPTRASWLMTTPLAQLTPEEQRVLEKLLASNSQIEVGHRLGLEFISIVRERKITHLKPWIDKVTSCGIHTLVSFARSLHQDYDAVVAALLFPWSNGQVEGQINRLKLIKREMYGRANFDLLRLRVLYQPP